MHVVSFVNIYFNILMISHSSKRLPYWDTPPMLNSL